MHYIRFVTAPVTPNIYIGVPNKAWVGCCGVTPRMYNKCLEFVIESKTSMVLEMGNIYQATSPKSQMNIL